MRQELREQVRTDARGIDVVDGEVSAAYIDACKAAREADRQAEAQRWLEQQAQPNPLRERAAGRDGGKMTVHRIRRD